MGFSGTPWEAGKLTVTQEAAAIWQSADGGRLPLSVGAECPGAALKEVDGLSVIGWGPVPGEAIGLTSPVTNGSDGVVEGGIILEPESPWMTQDRCIAAILLHESGHHLGLGDQPAPPSIMMASGPCIPHLSDSDIEAIRHLYP